MKRQRSVKVAVIDSGINPYHSHIGHVSGGISISVNKEMLIEYREDYRDRLGHGTAVAAAVREECGECELYSIRIFDEKLATYPSVLAAGLEWAIEQQMEIINLSLGTAKEDERLRALCKTAHEKGMFIMAALDEQRGGVYPAKYEGVYAVSSGSLKPGQFEYLGERRFQACGYPRELTGDHQVYNLHGHSFASARMSGIIAKSLLHCPFPMDKEQVIEWMVQGQAINISK